MAGVTQTDAGTVQPAVLARGLRRVALELGVKIYEASPMTGLDRARPNRVRTGAGSVTCDSVVLALGAWMGRFRELRRAFVPIGSSVVVTEPLGDRLLERPFANGEGIGDLRLSVHHMQVTADGRLVFGRGGGPLGPAGRVTASVLYDARSIRAIVKDLRGWFPDLADARITHAWSGAVDRSPSHLPFIGGLGDHGTIHYASGLSGQGVAQSAYLGRVLGRRVLGMQDADTSSPLTHGPTAFMPPEPARSLGGAVLRASVEWAEGKQEEGWPLKVNKVFKTLISTTTPRALEPRLWRSGSRAAADK
jgi:glycine/D-amino acid oxidase-like deaminating enzyme